jgi:hypothetical protein
VLPNTPGGKVIVASDPPNLSNAATANRAPLKKRGGCGCFGSVTGAILLALAVLIGLNPWALHIGGRWTPALTWHGVGKLQSTSGVKYGLFLEVSVYMRSRRRSSIGSSDNLSGTAKICTPQGEIYPLNVRGYIKQVWLDVDRKPVTFYFYSLKDAQPQLNFELFGSWQGQQLVLEDKGNMAMSFAPDGRAKGYLVGQNSPKENTSGTLHYATEDEFAGACNAKGSNSF